MSIIFGLRNKNQLRNNKGYMQIGGVFRRQYKIVHLKLQIEIFIT